MNPSPGYILLGIFTLTLLTGCGPDPNTMEVFWENGNPKQVVALNEEGGWDGTAYSYFESGELEEEVNYKNDELHGACTLYSSPGQLLETGHYEHGAKSGCWEYYYPITPQGALQLKETGCYQVYDYGLEQVSRKEGLWTYYSEGGQKIRKGHYLEDMETGLWKEWWANGNPRSQGVFNFCYLSYDPNTPPLLSREKMGLWEYWDAEGNSIPSENF